MRKRNWLYFAYYFAYWLSIGCLSPYLGLFYQQRGMSGTQIGILTAIASFATLPAAMLVGPLADKSRAPRNILFALVAGILVVFAVLYALHGFWLLALAIMLYGFASNPTSDVADTLLMEQIREKPETYGNYRLGGSAGFMVGVTVSGILLDMLGLPSLFVAACLMLLLTLLVVRGLPTSERVPRPAVSRRIPLHALYKSRAFVPAFVTLLIWGITDSGVIYFISLHIVNNGLDASYTSVLLVAAMIGEMALFFLAPYILRKIGPLQTIALGFLLQALRMIALFAIQFLPAPVQIAAQFLGGGAFALVYASDTEFIRQNFAQDVAYTAQSLKAVANKGVGIGLGALLFGRILDVLGTNAAFALMGVLCALYIVFLLAYARRIQKHEPQQAAQP